MIPSRPASSHFNSSSPLLLAGPTATKPESSALIVGESESLVAELLSQDAVLFDEIVHDLGLMAIGPACEGGEKKLKMEDAGHDGVIVPLRRKVVS